MSGSRAMRLFVGLTLALATGCAAQSDKRDQELHELTQRIQRLQSTTDRLEERVLAIEHLRNKPQSPAQPISGASSTMPDLPVVKMNADPRDAPPGVPAGAEDAGEPRPLIVGEGSRIETRSGGGELPPVSNSNTKRSKEKSSADVPAKRPSERTVPEKKAP